MGNRIAFIGMFCVVVGCGDSDDGGSSGTGGTSAATGGTSAATGGTSMSGTGGSSGMGVTPDAGPVAMCPDGTTCQSLGGTNYCAASVIAPSCTTQDDCDWGECQTSALGMYCILDCVLDVPDTVAISGTVLDMVPGSGFAAGGEEPLEGVEVCILDDADIECVTTDDKGVYGFTSVPTGADVGLTFDKDGYQAALRMVASPVADVSNVPPHTRMSTVADAEARAVDAGATYPDDANGTITFGALELGDGNSGSKFAVSIAGLTELVFLADATVTIDPSAGLGPVYVDADEAPDTTLTATSEAGWGTFFNVPPGDYTLTFEHPRASDCGADGTSVTVVAGRVTTNVGGICAEPTP